MNFSTMEPDGQGMGRGLILCAIYLTNPGRSELGTGSVEHFMGQAGLTDTLTD